MGGLCSCAEGLVSRFSGGGQPPLQAASFDGGVVGPHTKVANFTVAGDGCAIANTVIEQDQVYFEVTVKRAGCVGVGLTRKKSPDELVGHLGDGRTSWVFRSDSFGDLATGAVIGVSYDQLQAPSMLDFFLDGEKVRMRGRRGGGNGEHVRTCADVCYTTNRHTAVQGGPSSHSRLCGSSVRLGASEKCMVVG